MIKRIFPVLMVTGLAGCGSMPFELIESTPSNQPMQTSLGTSIPPSQSMAALPTSAGAVVSVIERQRGNALQHEVTLHGAPPNYGENQIQVTAFRSGYDATGKSNEDQVPNQRPTADDINNEMSEKIPGGPLPISNAAPQNGAGAFAYAFGRKNNVSCMYAWQWVEGQRFGGSPVSVRVRLCKPGTTEEVLVDYMRQLFLMPRSTTYGGPAMVRGPAVRPYGDALSASRRIGATQGYAYQHPYGAMYAPVAVASSYPKADTVERTSAAPRAVAAVRTKRVVVRRIVRRRVVAPQIYSYSPPPVASPAISQPAPVAGGYSAVPMPQ